MPNQIPIKVYISFILYLHVEARVESVEVCQSHLEYRVGYIETAVAQLQSAMSFHQAATFGGPASFPGLGGPSSSLEFGGPRSVPGFRGASACRFGYYHDPGHTYNQPTQYPPGFGYAQPEWSFQTTERNTPMLESSNATAQSPSTTASVAQLPPVSSSSGCVYLLSSSIDKTTLHDVDQVVNENIKLKNKDKAATLCQILARQCFFGKEVMGRCTPGGKQGFGLPREELYAPKQTMFDMFPKYKDCPEQFEPIWED